MPSNFTTNQDFPTYVSDLATYSADGEPTDYDYYTAAEIQNEIEELNESLRFHSVRLTCGYYSGIQITAEPEYTRPTFASKIERTRLLHEMERIADEYGFFEYSAREVFDNEPLFRYA